MRELMERLEGRAAVLDRAGDSPYTRLMTSPSGTVGFAVPDAVAWVSEGPWGPVTCLTGTVPATAALLVALHREGLHGPARRAAGLPEHSDGGPGAWTHVPLMPPIAVAPLRVRHGDDWEFRWLPGAAQSSPATVPPSSSPATVPPSSSPPSTSSPTSVPSTSSSASVPSTSSPTSVPSTSSSASVPSTSSPTSVPSTSSPTSVPSTSSSAGLPAAAVLPFSAGLPSSVLPFAAGLPSSVLPGEELVRRLDASEDAELEALIDRGNPVSSSRPGQPRVRAWYGIRSPDTGQLIACGADRSRNGVGFLAGITVDPPRRGEGLGAALTAAMTQQLYEEFGAVALGVTIGNERAIRLYERLGFTEVLTRTSFTVGP